MRFLRYLRDAAVFAPCYIVLDWVSYIHPLGPFNITPWNPQPALAIAWMLLGGLVHAPVVVATIVLADVVVRGVPAGYGVTFLSALTLGAGYTTIAAALRLLLPRARLSTVRQLTTFVATVVPATGLIALAFVLGLQAAGALGHDATAAAVLRFWVGDAVGVLVTAPLLLVAADPEGRRSFAALAARRETYAQVALIAATLWLIFDGFGGDPSHHFYLLFPPLIWIALRNGLAGAIAAVGVIQVGVVVGMHQRPIQTLPVTELQALVAALTLTALYLGVIADEHWRATENLRQSLRLAAAGEMAGAIAHEVNQPLTALANYGQATRTLLAAGRSAEAEDAVRKMMAEAQRASDVVRRLRDLFREGTTRLEQVSVAELLAAVRRIGATVRGDSGVVLTVEGDECTGTLLVDRIQIEVVLRNLVSNAFESVQRQPRDPRHVTVRAGKPDAAHLQIAVSDNGEGVPASMHSRIFEPFVSGKPKGMGLGLAVSRAIAEAHGGTLQIRAASHGEFHLVLPLEAPGA